MDKTELDERKREFEKVQAKRDAYRERAEAAEAEATKLREAEKRSEWREGIVNVLDHEGNYLGCMGVNTWAALGTTEASNADIDNLRALYEKATAVLGGKS